VRLYNEEFLPALGVTLPPYDKYKQNVEVAITEEFANCAYRMHSMVQGVHLFPSFYLISR
jgi:hypothetical protein